MPLQSPPLNQEDSQQLGQSADYRHITADFDRLLAHLTEHIAPRLQTRQVPAQPLQLPPQLSFFTTPLLQQTRLVLLLRLFSLSCACIAVCCCTKASRPAVNCSMRCTILSRTAASTTSSRRSCRRSPNASVARPTGRASVVLIAVCVPTQPLCCATVRLRSAAP